MSKLAIIGASYLQRPLVMRAKEMGIETICFAWAEGAVCREVCDRFYPISITEKEQILAICREEKIDGVCTIASDIAAPTVAYIAEQMGLTGNRYEASLRAHDKHQMREVLTAAGIDCPRFLVVKSSEYKDKGLDFRDANFAFPLIVKPSDRSGSLAVARVADQAALEAAVAQALEVSIAGEALIEEYIEGREISVEMISCRGTHYALQITDKTTTGAPHFVELAHHQPSSLPAAMQEQIFSITRRALDALGITNGASHSEYKITAEGRIVVMEIAGRMGGDFIGSDLVQISTGYDFLRGVIEVALGKEIKVETQPIAHSSVIFDAPENVSCSAERTGYRIYRNERLVSEGKNG